MVIIVDYYIVSMLRTGIKVKYIAGLMQPDIETEYNGKSLRWDRPWWLDEYGQLTRHGEWMILDTPKVTGFD